MLFTGRASLARGALFVTAQCLGAVAGAGLLKGLTPAVVQAALGLPTVNRQLTVEQGFGVEFVVTFVLVLTVFASSDPERPRLDVGPTASLAIGISVTSCHLFAVRIYIVSPLSTDVVLDMSWRLYKTKTVLQWRGRQMRR